MLRFAFGKSLLEKPYKSRSMAREIPNNYRNIYMMR